MWNLSRISACHCSARCGGREDGEPLDLAAVEQLAGDEQRLDGLADADVVGDEQADRVEPQRHQQRHELVRARLDGDPAEAAERPGAVAHREPERVAEQARRGVVAEVGGGRRREAWRAATSAPSKARSRPVDLVVGAAERAQDEQRRRPTPGRTTHSRPRARTSEPGRSGSGVAGAVTTCAAAGLPNTLGYLARTAGQVASSSRTRSRGSRRRRARRADRRVALGDVRRSRGPGRR